ncbi:MAG: precorrin-6y C5,15-methyltransferase (decarboxylating) subunit CbiE [Rhodobiaceae bacterium]|nr:precorrin-6y C5,15-methyltransferase (decarboxylating) subunit CbiE [Rhodobiaceae bacterium]
MSGAWLHVIGIGEDGLDGLPPASRAALEGAEVVIGGERHQTLTDGLSAERLTWPSPFSAMIGTIRSYAGRQTAIVVTGDPLWFSAGEAIAAEFAPEDVRFYPHVSAFQLACARMGWSIRSVATLSIHGRPASRILPDVRPGARLVVLTSGGQTPAEVARLLTFQGYGPSRLTVLADMGGPTEYRIAGVAESWEEIAPDFHTLCIECEAAEGTAILPRGPGLPDDAFVHDGKITKQEVRAVTLARLAPERRALLWDIGCGCGSVSVEWMRMAPYARAIGIEPDAARRDMTLRNAEALGAPALELVAGAAPDALAGLEAPDAVFIGGGLSKETVSACLAALKPHGRLVANAVTLESEQLLADLQATYGGALCRLAVSRAEPVGRYRGWRPFMPVTQWSFSL